MMSNNRYNKTHATAICEEFCRYVITDNLNESILFNAKQEYYHEVRKRLEDIGYIELFRASITPKLTVTCVFVCAEVTLDE